MKRKVLNILIVVCAVVLVAAAAVLIYLAVGYWQGQDSYTQIAEEAVEQPAEEESELAKLSVDWDKLLKKNADTVGWMTIPGTEVDYPIVQASDNNKYLHLNFNGEAATGLQPTYGTPFLLAENASDFSDAVNIIQAHNMANGSMFAENNKMLNSKEERDSHRTVYIMSPTCNYRCETFAIVTCASDDEIVQTSFKSKEAFAAYVKDVVSRSAVELDLGTLDLDSVEKLFVLSTCTNDSLQRCLVFCAVTQSAEL